MLNVCLFCLSFEDVVINDFNEWKKVCVALEVANVLIPTPYVEKWHILLSDEAFYPLTHVYPRFATTSKL